MADRLYRRAIESPGDIDDTALAEWMGEAAEVVGNDRDLGRALRKAVRSARKLARYFGTKPAQLPDWRNGVDEALGSRGWEPQLELVRGELSASPSEEAFLEVKARHRAVHFTEWMEGVSFADWLESSS
jgi:hypothetical protein